MAIEKNHYSVIILGSGPAGLTAAIYTARAGLTPLVIEGIQPGGQLTITTEVENYPGFPDGVMGPQLMDMFREQAEKFGTSYITDMATSVDLRKRPFTVMIDKQKLTADAIIISTGATARLLGLESESMLMGRGVSACATCDGWFFRGKEIVVIGGGDSACEEADYLTKFASKVTMIHRRDKLRATTIMRKRVFDNPKVEILWNHIVVDFVGSEETMLQGVQVKHTQTREESLFKCDGAFLALGHRPNTELFVGQLDLNENGYLITKPDCSLTNIPGVFACGDVQDHTYQQAVTAAGSGCIAAIDAERFLTEQEE
ncbi:MAG: thioredoxin-disulfide reductase [Candidatus Electryoneaceae bacterium]|nr:thioredoxin-disulfide reductase [Candidatus Electryoneaceae bacterium]